MSVWPSFIERAGSRFAFARIDVGYTVGDRIAFEVFPEGPRMARILVRKEPVLPAGWVLLTVDREPGIPSEDGKWAAEKFLDL